MLKNGMRAMAAAMLGALGLGGLFAESALAPDRWTTRPGKRSRSGSFGRPHPKDYIHDAYAEHGGVKVSALDRLRFRREAPSMLDRATLRARGSALYFNERGKLFVKRASRMGFGFLRTNARPHYSKSSNVSEFAGTKGNHGQTIARKLRRDFNSGIKAKRSAAVARAAKLGVIL